MPWNGNRVSDLWLHDARERVVVRSLCSMRREYQIAIVLAVATVPCGAGLAVAPEYLHLKGAALAATFWGGFALTLALIVLAFILALRAEAQTPPKGHRRRMLAIIGMAVCGFGFLAFAILFFVERPAGIQVAQPVPPTSLPIVKAPTSDAPIAPPPAATPAPIVEAPTVPPPVATPPPPIPPEKRPKEFVDAYVTPEFLVGLYEGQTALGGEMRASKYIGKWIKVSGPLFETVGGWPLFGERSPVVTSFASQQGPTVTMIFRGKSIDRLAMIPKNQNISVLGQINEIGRSKIGLDNCELMDSESK
jgi:hypothetical protein